MSSWLSIVRAVNASDASESFHVLQQKKEAERVHPHRELVESLTAVKTRLHSASYGV